MSILKLWIFLPKVLSVPHVPGGGVTDHLASVVRLHQHGVVPEVVKHPVQTHRHEEPLCFFKKSPLTPALEIDIGKLFHFQQRVVKSYTYTYMFLPYLSLNTDKTTKAAELCDTFSTIDLLTSISVFSGKGIDRGYKLVQNRPHISPKQET